jgi:hypothetical protein
MPWRRRALLVCACLITPVFAVPAWAETSSSTNLLFRHRSGGDVWHVDFTDAGETAPNVLPADFAQPVHAAAIQHSDAYLTRAKIHRIASYASLPLFALEVYLGQSLYNSPTNNNKGAHVFVGTALVGLFGVNTVTGAWNLFGTEGRSDRQDRTIKLVHGLLMMAADVGFVATLAVAPHSHRFTVPSQSARSLHRNVALTAIGLGTAGYMVMFVHNF